MRRYTMRINDNPYEVDVEHLEGGTFQVLIGGRSLEVELTSSRQLVDAPVAPGIDAAPGADAAPPAARAPRVPSAVRSSATGSPSPTAPGGADPARSMSAPMPGVIAEVGVSAGDRVAKGDTVLVLEAMKMRNDLHASRSGTVEEVLVAQGDQVRYAQPLLRFARD